MYAAIGAILLAGVVVRLYRRNVPVRGLQTVELADLPVMMKEQSNLQLVDLRDYLEYEKDHYPDAINLPPGRLGLYWQRYLDEKKSVVLIAGKRGNAYMAARFLRRKGISIKYLVLYSRAEGKRLNRCA